MSANTSEVSYAHTLCLEDLRFCSLAFLLHEPLSPPYFSPDLVASKAGCANGLANVVVQKFVRFIIQL